MRGIIWVQDSSKKPNRSDVITVKASNKLQFHCFKRFRSFPFTFDAVLDEHADTSLYAESFDTRHALNALAKDNDYMLYCCGNFKKADSEMISKTCRLFYEQLEPVFNELVKTQLCTMRINIFSVGEDIVYDLISAKSVWLREISNNKP